MHFEEVFAALSQHEDEMVALRHDIHMHPETSYEEHRTSGIVMDKLAEWGIEAHKGLAGTGVVAVIKGNRPGNRSVGLRADMDALNMTETNTFGHKSTIPGKFHGCGHDGHTTMLLSAARYLKANPDFAGTVHCIFQPAEEGGAGGLKMIEDGLFEQFPCDAVYSLHNKPGLPVGKFITRVGGQLACADTWVVRFKGTGGHAGAPEKSTDTTIPLAHFILGVQSIVSRNIVAQESAVLTVGMIEAGTSHNVMPSEIVVTGTARCHNPVIRDLLEKRLGEVAEACAAMSGCTAELDYQRGYPPLVNAREQTDIAIAAAAAVAGAENVDGNSAPINAADDFAYMAIARPGCNVMMGNGDGPEWKNNHMPDYDFNDAIIPWGAAYWVSVVNQELGGQERETNAAA
ncbi:amidohydrolase [Pseudooceanicola sediminis]|uniref:Amidohydrolase n=1 Tax=Pseudooceanicola sediminis TaxID=2211117 RepID=A0A399J2A1_9RHOB|nr:M20 aminoacylase family protein [Pseudooceanicola sediminis]KAA2317210.1 amidohydrolase [Puniceibacterium sp. HSS470]RII39563.1 amidohydrolase [Pseudooceanicola sediminis]|tara:strand:+ start:14521 stop:15726 length:1206 start_codon:yes stop_codon:yes gene_type:complete